MKPEEIGSKNNNKGWAKDKAEEYFLKALAIKENSLGPNHPDVARILNRLGSVCILSLSLFIFASSNSCFPFLSFISPLSLSNQDTERVQLNIAEQYLTRAYKIRKEKLGPYHSRVGQTLKRIFL